MFNNGLGTTIYTYFFGVKVGEDDRGNTYFISKHKPYKKWVLYNHNNDPTNLPVIWQFWLTSKEKNMPKIDEKEYHWQKDRDPNPTGTQASYHPAVNISREKKHLKNKELVENNKKIWRP